MDDYSRFIVAHKVCTTQTGDIITSVFHEAVDKYGLPKQLLTDRGSQFARWKGIKAFQEMLGNLGVEQFLTQSQSPQTIGYGELYITRDNAKAALTTLPPAPLLLFFFFKKLKPEERQSAATADSSDLLIWKSVAALLIGMTVD